MPIATSDAFRPFTSPEARARFLTHLDALEHDWPKDHERHMVATEFGETFVRMGGPLGARPIVLLPGGQTNSLEWCRLIEPLAEAFRTYALDAIYDQGRSVPTRPVRTVDELCRWIDSVLDRLGLERGVILAGQSYGCYAAAEYALYAQHRLSKLVWIAPVMIGAPLSAEFVEHLKTVADGERQSLEAFCRWIMPSIAASHAEEFARRVDEILLVRETYGSMTPPARTAVISDADLRRIEIPALYILGECDRATAMPHEAIKRVESCMRRAETTLIPDAGHDVVAAETERVTEVLMRFLRPKAAC